MSSEAKQASEVIDAERHEIRRRRAVHDASKRQTEGPFDSEEDELTGIALSGGGIRSAAFSLGFVQSMYRAGRLKAFDYLSTVSGGGYSGGLVSSTIARHKSRIDWSRKGTNDRLPFEYSPEKGQPDSLRRLALHGRLMGNFLRLFSRHLWGFLINVTFIVSGLVVIASLLAYFMRIPWDANVANTISEIGFRSDVTVPFFFSFLALLAWCAAHLVAHLAKSVKWKIAPFTQYGYVFLLTMVVSGIITMFAIGDVDVGQIFGSNTRLSGIVNTVTSWIGIAFGVVFIASLLPYLSPKRLLKSGAPGASPVQSLIFRAAGNAAIVGAPLFIFFLLVHEDISGYATSRPDADQLTPSHMGSPVGFAMKLEADGASPNKTREALAKRLFEALNGEEAKGWPTSDFESELKETRQLDLARQDLPEFAFPTRCLQWLANAIGIDEQFGERVKLRKRQSELNDKIVNRFNLEALSNPNLFLTLEIQDDAQNTNSGTESTNSDRSDRDRISARMVALGLTLDDPPSKEQTEIRAALERLRRDRLQFASAFNLNLASNAKQLVEASQKSAAAAEKTPVPEKTPDPEKTAKTSQQNKESASGQFAEAVSFLAADPINEDAKRLNGPFVDEVEQLLDKDDQLKSQIKEYFEKASIDVDFDDNVFKDWRNRNATSISRLANDIRLSNWELLRAIYPENIRSRDTVFARVVNGADQSFRLQIAGYALAVFLLVGLLTNLNNTSLHGVYRDQLAEIWLEDPTMKIEDLDTCSKGGPYHLINAAVNRMGHRDDPDVERRSRFLISQRFCGTKKVGYRETDKYENGTVSVADAIAISGGAVTTVGAPSPIYQLVLFLTNFRLGQWAINPQKYGGRQYWCSPIRAMLNLLWYPEQRSYLFISDGGHIDNTGLAALMERRCGMMVAVDASHDPDYEFTDLLKLFHAARAKYGIHVQSAMVGGRRLSVSETLDLLRPKQHDQSDRQFVVLEVKYPDVEKPAILIYTKLTVAGDEPVELVELARSNRSFPHDPTSDQFLPPEVFESYMSLGYHIGSKVDEFVRSGGLDDYSLQQGWHSENPQSSPDDASEETLDSKVEELSEAIVRKALIDAPFDEENIDRAIHFLDCWWIQFPQNQETGIVESINSWALEHGPDASLRLRRRFCEPLMKHIEKYDDELRQIPNVRLCYFDMLGALGSQVKGTSSNLKQLASISLNATTEMDGSQASRDGSNPRKTK